MRRAGPPRALAPRWPSAGVGWPALALVLAGAGCHAAEVTVAGTEDLGPLETTSAVKARDGGYSARFEGHSVWLYGDTILSVEGEHGSWDDNSWSWSDDTDASDGVTGFSEPVDSLGAPLEFFPETDDEHTYNEAHRDQDLDGDGTSDCEDPCGGREVLWPKAMVVPATGPALIFYVKIHGEPGAWNFYDRGTGIATWETFADPVTRPVVDVVTDEPTLTWSADTLQPGDAALVVDDTVYAWACEAAGGDGLTKPCTLARALAVDALDPAAWAWYSGGVRAGADTWSADPLDATVLFQGAAQLSISWNAHLERYLAVYDDLGGVKLRTAPAPQGPWSDELHAFDTLEPADGFTYAGLAHDELEADGGRSILVSYYRSTGDWTGEIRIVRVTLE